MTARMDPPAFTPQSGGVADERWLRSPLRSTAWLQPPSAGDVLLVVAAHPDDESLGAAGLISVAHANGAAVRVVVATDGAASHPASPTHDALRIATRRRAELHAAVELLASGAQVSMLGLPDGRLAEHTDALAALLSSHLDGVTHVATTWRGDGHPDHTACADALSQLDARVVRWQFPIWAWHWADPDGDDLPWSRIGRLALPPEALAAKQAAIDAHVSQHSALSPRPGDEPVLPPQLLRHFARDFETFVVNGAPAADPAYFDELYGARRDPWGLDERFYERRKRELLLAALPKARFRRAFEPGCANGALTARLAERCESIVAWDVAEAAVRTARAVAGPAATVERGAIPDRWPTGQFDLVVLSEVGYYCIDLDLLVQQVDQCLAADGVVVACHWRRAAPDHPYSGDHVHSVLDTAMQARGRRRTVHHREDDFVLDVWSARGSSVAQAEGIVP